MLKLIQNTLSNTGAKLISLILGLVATPVLIKSVGDEGYGLLMLIPTITGYFDLLGGGVPAGTVKFIAQYEAQNDRPMVYRILDSSLAFFSLVGVLVCLGLLIFTHAGGLNAFNISPQNASAAKFILTCASFLALLSWPTNAMSATLEGLQEHHKKNVANSITAILSISGAILAAKLGANILQVFIAQNVAYLIRWGWLAIIVKQQLPQWRPRPHRAQWAIFKMIFGLSVWMLALQVASLLNYKLDELILSSVISVASLTVYNILTQPFKLVQQASGMFNSAIMPAVSAYEAKQGRAGLDVFIYTGVRYNNLLVAPLAITATYFCGPFIKLWVGPRFLDLVWIAQLSCAFQLIWQSNSMLGRVFYGTGRVERIAMIAFVTAAINATLSILLVPDMGVAGVILATVLVGGLAVIAQYFLLFPLLEIPKWRYLRDAIIKAQWPHWLIGLALIPLWSTIQAIDSWPVFIIAGFGMLFTMLAVSWRIGVLPEHRSWAVERIRTALKKRKNTP